MDTTQTILLTSLVNIIITGLVGGILIYTFQKRIDAAVQKSLFEHQTRFIRNHQKRMETLETLYTKYRAVEEYFLAVLGTQEDEAFNLYPLEVEDFRNYFSYSRLYLSEEEIIELDDIFDKLRYLIMLTRIRYGSEAYSSERIITANEIIKDCSLQITPLNTINPDRQLLEKELYIESVKQNERFIKLYSSATK